MTSNDTTNQSTAPEKVRRWQFTLEYRLDLDFTEAELSNWGIDPNVGDPFDIAEELEDLATVKSQLPHLLQLVDVGFPSSYEVEVAS